jgi:hypothetical protein
MLTVASTVASAAIGFGQVKSPDARPIPPAVPVALPTPAATPIETLGPRASLSAATVQHLARMTPIFDGRTLDGWIQAPLAPIRFAREDIPDLAAFARHLAAKPDVVSAWVVQMFDDAGRTALAALANTSAPAPREAVSALLRNLSALASGASVYDPARFAGVALRPETEALRRKNAHGYELARLNRLLLEDAFPGLIVKSPSAGWVVKNGAMASTGASRGSVFTAKDYAHYRIVFQVRQISGNHVPGVLVFCMRPSTRGDLAEAQAGIDALGGIQFQVPNGGHWDYRPGVNKAGAHFTRPVRIRYNMNEWSQVELLVNAKTGLARMAVAQPVGTKAIENLVFEDPAAGKPGPFALQMHNAGLFDEFRELKIEIDPKDDRLITVE